MKLLLLLAALLVPSSAEAQLIPSAPNATDLYAAGRLTTFKCALTALAATLTQCQAAPAAGKLYIASINVQTSTTTSGTYAIQTGTGTNCGTGTAALFPSSSTAARFNAPITTSAMASILFPVPLDAPATSAICVIGTATNTIHIQIIGYVAP